MEQGAKKCFGRVLEGSWRGALDVLRWGPGRILSGPRGVLEDGEGSWPADRRRFHRHTANPVLHRRASIIAELSCMSRLRTVSRLLGSFGGCTQAVVRRLSPVGQSVRPPSASSSWGHLGSVQGDPQEVPKQFRVHHLGDSTPMSPAPQQSFGSGRCNSFVPHAIECSQGPCTRRRIKSSRRSGASL